MQDQREFIQYERKSHSENDTGGVVPSRSNAANRQKTANDHQNDSRHHMVNVHTADRVVFERAASRTNHSNDDPRNHECGDKREHAQ